MRDPVVRCARSQVWYRYDSHIDRHMCPHKRGSERPMKAREGQPPHMDQETLDRVLDAHQQWLDSNGKRGRRAMLAGADMSNMDLNSVCLERADLSGVDLTDSDLSEAILGKAKLSRAKLGSADLSNASLRETDLTWADMKGVRLISADLTGACLPDVDLTDARLRNADFTNADLEGADLRGADITGVILNGTDLTGTVFDSTPTTDAGMDEAYEAQDVLEEEVGGEIPVLVSELPDADEFEDHSHHVGGEAWVPEKQAPEPAVSTPVASADPMTEAVEETLEGRLDQLFSDHERWVDTEGREGVRADLSDVSGVFPHHLAGRDLTGAILPPALSELQGIAYVVELARMARRVFMLLLIGCLYAFVAMGTAPVHQFGQALSAIKLPFLGVSIPSPMFLMVAPLFLTGGYLYQLVYLQRLWEGIAGLPAVLPDGRGVDKAVSPWLAVGFVRLHIRRLLHRKPLWRLQIEMAAVLIWGVVPAMLTIIWGAAVAVHASSGVLAYHGILLAVATAFGVYTYLLARRTLRNPRPNSKP